MHDNLLQQEYKHGRDPDELNACLLGRIGSELSRRLGQAHADFRTLQRVWSHAAISRPRKVQIYNACIVSKLLCSLHTAWLSKTERRRLDGFQARCLRRIEGIPPSYLSRVPNTAVLSQANAQKLSSTLLYHQLQYMGALARRPSGDVVRDSVFVAGSIALRSSTKPRARGRPRTTWAAAVFAHAEAVAGGAQHLSRYWSNTQPARAAWRSAAKTYVGMFPQP